jgi:uncharacterized protein (DUF2336 family)
VSEDRGTVLDARVFDSVLLQGGAEARKELGRQIAMLLRDPASRADEREAVTPTLLRLAGDPVFEVRHTVAQHVSDLDSLHVDVLFTIVADDDRIALPFLAVTPALDSLRMLAVLRVGDTARRIQIAQRPDISRQCAAFIVADAEWQVAAALLDNAAYEPASDEYKRLFVRLGAQPEIIERLLSRPGLPLEIRILEARQASRRIHAFLDKAGLASSSEQDDLADAEDSAMLRVMVGAPDKELDRVLPFLLDRKLLTPMLVMKAAAVGAMAVVDRVLAQLAGMPLGRVQALIYGRGSISLRAVFNRCGLPESCMQMLRAAVEVERMARERRRPLSSDDFGVRLVEIVMTRFMRLTSAERSRLLDFIARLGTGKSRAVAERLKVGLSQAA